MAPDGTAYFTDFGNGAVGRVAVDGRATLWKSPASVAKAFGIAYAHDGTCWFTEWSNGGENRLSSLRLDTLAYDCVEVGDFGTPRNVIVVGNQVFFTVGPHLGRLSIDDLRLTVHPFPAETAWRRLEATPLAYDGSGGIWVGFGGGLGYLGRFDPGAATWEVVELGPYQLTGLAVAADGAVWFTSFGSQCLGRLAPDGELEVRGYEGHPFAISSTARGELWVSEFSNNRLTRLDAASGNPVTRVDLPASGSEPLNVTSDSAGVLWYAAQKGGVGRVCVHEPPGNGETGHVEEIAVAAPARRLRDVSPTFAGEPGDFPPYANPIGVKIEEHGSFLRPVGDVTLWRYLDLAKFVSMLESQALFFARLDTQPDPFEGSLPQRGGSDLDFGELSPGGLDARRASEFVRLHRDSLSRFRPRALISCWHMNDYESMAMWELYAQSGSGIGVRSSSRRLIESLETAAENPPTASAYVGVVRYIDYNTTFVLPNTALDFLTFKRTSFAHEQELRVVVLSINPLAGGQNIACNLEILVGEIFVSPAAPGWFRDAVQAVVDRFGFRRTVRQSDLDQDPLL